MKRQRGEDNARNDDGDSEHLSFDAILRLLRQATPNLTCDQLSILAQEIDTSYKSTMSSLLTQNFPPELWGKIALALPSWESKGRGFEAIKFWLACRTVSKAWLSWISKFDFSSYQPSTTSLSLKLNLNHLLPLMKFSTLCLDDPSLINEVSLLTNVTNLDVYSATAILPAQIPMISMLTQLTTYQGLIVPTPLESLLCLTNLTSLSPYALGPTITTLSTLTNLTHLNLGPSPAISQAVIFQELPRLTDMVSSNPSFFQTGRGTCRNFNDGWFYKGEWLNGQRHGQGKCEIWGEEEAPGCRFTGQWEDDKPNGKCIWEIGDDEWRFAYEGNFVDGKKEGFGTRKYKNGDTYEGCWIAGERAGPGYYWCSHLGALYDGDWSHGRPDGFGRHRDRTGLVFEGFWDQGEATRGRWKVGKRSEDGIWDLESAFGGADKDEEVFDVRRNVITVDSDNEDSVPL